jgi:peptide/nickel transport system ATP-binding protein
VPEGDVILDVKDLRTHFYSREGVVRAVDGVSFSIVAGRSLGIAGESGCGKSVTSQSILRIVPRNGRIVGGQILWRREDRTVDIAGLDPVGREIRAIRGGEIAMIFQEPMSAFSPVHTIGNQIMEAIALHQKCDRRESRRKAVDLLAKVGMPRPAQTIDAYPFNLSGGMRQRAMMASALSCMPRLLIADEPTTAVDVTVQAQMLELIRALQKELGMALIVITHDLAVISELADAVLVMYLGKDVEHASVDDLFGDPLHPSTRGLLASIPKLKRGPREKVVPIAGSVPNAHEVPDGCPFHPRCPSTMAGRCDAVDPPRVEARPGHTVRCHLYARGGGG